MNWNFDNERPIYKQLIEKLQIFIITEKYPPGEKLPSVRELAIKVKVNPNTVQKVMQELEGLGLVYSKRTSGRYITEDRKLIADFKKKIATEKVRDFLSSMQELEMSRKDAIEYLKEEENRE